MGENNGPWLVRIEDARGCIHGAGTLLTATHVLTCAHVVEQAGGQQGSVYVRVKGRADVVRPATVLADCWWPEQAHHRADIAVLVLDAPVAEAPQARFQRTWQRGDRIRAFGFPAGTDNGQAARASVAGLDFFEERAQLNALKGEPRVTQGFSGAPALADNGEVLGMIVSVHDPTADSSWMITVRTLRSYVGQVIDLCLTDRPSIDPQFSRPADAVAETLGDPVRLALTRELVDWVESEGPGGVCAVGGGAAVPLVARLVGLTHTEYRSAAPRRALTDAPQGTLPRLGTVDAAVDATGKTTEQIALDLVERLGLAADAGADLADRLRELGSPAVIAVNAVDSAADPEELYYRLVQPIAVHAPGIGVRLLLGFHDNVPAYLRSVLATGLIGRTGPAGAGGPGDRPTELADRCARLAALTDRIAVAERTTLARYEQVAPRVLGTPERRLAGAAALRVRVRVLRDLCPTPGSAGSTATARLMHETDACERMADRALARTRSLHSRLDALLAQRDRLRERLQAYRTRAATCGLLEDLGESYERARRRLYAGPCDLRLAERDVEAYVLAVRRTCEGRSS